MNQPQNLSERKESASRWAALRDLFSKTWVRCTVLVLAGFLPRVPALQGQPLWDDGFLIRDNPFIRSPLFLLEVFRHHLFLDSFSAHYRPVQNISMMFDYFVWGSNTFGYHLTNILLHTGSALVLYFLLRRLLFPLLQTTVSVSSSFVNGCAFLVALLWAVHPVHSAAIDYMSGRADSLGFLLAGGAWLLFLRGRGTASHPGRWTFYALAWLVGLLALCSRENAALWIVLFLLYHLGFDRPVLARWKVGALVACLALAGAYAALHQIPGSGRTTGGSYDWPPALRAVLMLRALGDYGRLMLYPANLHMERTVFDPTPLVEPAARAAHIGYEYLSLAGFALLAAFAFLGARRGRGQRLRIFGAAWFLLTYLPISNLFDLNATVAEHWLYLPSVGFLAFLIGCAVDLSPRLRQASVAFAALAVLALSARSVVRSGDWITDVTFYERTLAAGGSSSRVIGNLAQLYTRDGAYAKAETMFREALKMAPDYPIARNNLAEALARQGKRAEAEALLAETSKQTEQTRKEYPRTWIPVINHALYREKDNDKEGALAIAEKARKDYPGVWEIIRFEINLVNELRGTPAAIALLEDFRRDHWWHHASAVALGRLYSDANDDVKAEKILRLASWLDVNDAEAFSVLAELRMRGNRLGEACALQKRALARQPDQARQYILLSNILDKMGRNDEAKAALAEVSRLRKIAVGDYAPKLAN